MAMRFLERGVGVARHDGRSHVLVTRGGRLTREDFSGRRLDQFSPEGTVFERCRFDGVHVSSASFGAGVVDSRFVECTFDNARLRMFSVGFARLERCSFEKVRIEEFFCRGLEMIDCTFSGTISGGWLSGTVPEEYAGDLGRSRNEIRGNDFSRARLINVGFGGGVDLRQQRLPEGPEYVYVDDFPGAVRRGRQAMLAHEDPGLRRAAFALLDYWGILIDGGQRQQLLREKDYSPSQRAAFRTLISVMMPDGRPA